MIRKEKGSVLILATVALVVLLILGVSIMGRAINALSTSNRARHQAVALNLAECGVDMAVVKLYEDYDSVNSILASAGYYSSSISTTTGQCNYVVTMPYEGIAQTVLIESTGTTNTGRTAQVRVVAKYMGDVSRVFQGAIFSNNPLTLNGAGSVLPDDSGEGGHIYANGDINFNGTSFTMDPAGYLYTTGETSWVPDGVPSTHVFEGVAPIPMPVIDLNWYRNNATTYYSGDTTFTGDYSVSGIIYVDGDVRISGNYTGQAILVASGKITVTGNLTASDLAVDTMALLSPRSIKINGNPTVHGLIYAHNAEAELSLGGSPTVYGAVVADVVTTNGAITIQYRDVWSALALPGTGQQQWSQVSWQRLR